jgi:guanylate kinase
VKQALRQGRDILFDIDWQGTQQLRGAFGTDLVRIFILPPSMSELERRLRARGTDSEEVIESRMRRAASEIGHWGEYDYVLINEDMNACLSEVRSIIEAERLRRDRRPYLFDFVRRLVERPNN